MWEERDGGNYFTFAYRKLTMITKANLLRTLEQMPEMINIDELLAGVLLIQKIEAGLSDSEKGNTIPHLQCKTEMNEWLKSIGQEQHKKP